MTTEFSAHNPIAVGSRRTPAEQIADFVRLLRGEGFAIGIQETLDGLRLVDLCDIEDLPSVRTGLRSLLCRSRDDWRRFDPLFDHYWFPNGPRGETRAATPPKRDPRIPRNHQTGGYTGLSHAMETKQPEDDNRHGDGGAGLQSALARSDFRFLTDRREMREMEQLAEHLARRLRQRLIRRCRVRPHGRKIHVRRTLRRSLEYGGLPVKLSYRQRKRQLPRFVLLLDVSHSMARYSYLLARFMRGLVLNFPDAEAFVFHTRLYRVTDLFRETDADALRRRLAGMTQLWFGGTRIADSLQHFNRLYGRRIVNGRSVVIIMSDGFDTDTPEQLAQELQLLRARARKMIWLNPMLERPGYQPDKGPMRMALPLLDLLAPAHGVESLRAVASYLVTL